MKLKYYVISLKQRTDRQAAMREQLERLGIDFEFFEGVNGRDLSDAEPCTVNLSQNWFKICQTSPLNPPFY